MANRKPPKLKRRFYGDGRPGVPFIPVVPPKPSDRHEWDDDKAAWLIPGEDDGQGLDKG